MTTPTTPRVQVPCPVCGRVFDWPPDGRCTVCQADLQGPLAAELWQLAREEAALRARQEDLRRQLTATAAPQVPPVPAAPPGRGRRHLTDLGAQTLLGMAGAALLTVAAVVFAAVTWEDLPTGARAGILVVAAGTAAWLALRLRERQLAVTAGALALLADALVGTNVWAAHTYGATGDLDDLAGAALAALGASLTALVLARRGIRWQPVASAATWVLAVALAALAAADAVPTSVVPTVGLAAALVAAGPALRLRDESAPRGVLVIAGAVGLVQTGVAAAVVLAVTDGVAMIWPTLAGIATATVWLVGGGRIVGSAAATSGLAMLGIGAFVTSGAPPSVVMAGTAGIAATAAATAVMVDTRRVPVLAGSVPAAAPAIVWTALAIGEGLAGWIRHATAPWAAPAPVVGPADAWLAVMVLLTAAAVVLAIGTQRASQKQRAIAVVLPVVGSTAVWHLGAEPWLLVIVAGGGALGGLLRLDRTSGRRSMTAWTVMATGWSLPSPVLSTLTAAAGAGTALIARRTPVGRHVEQSLLAVVLAATAAAGATVWVLGASDAAAVAGPIAVLAAVGVAAIGRREELHGVATALSLALVGAMAVVASEVVRDAASGARTSAVLAAGALVLAVLWRRDHTASTLHVLDAILAATATSAFVLHDAGVTTPEAYTAVPAVLALAAGAAWMRRDTTVRSWAALQPGLALAITPTLVLLAIDPQDTTRAVAAALLAATALLAGTTARIVAPLAHGAVATAVVVATQLVVVAGHVPRWSVYAVVGGLLLVASATFERQRLRAQAVREQLSVLRTSYR